MSKKNKRYMGLENTTLAKAITYDKPLLNIVYIPQIFQKERETYGNDYLYTIPVNEIVPTYHKIPYEEMKPPIVYISLGSIISNRGFSKMCIRVFGDKGFSVILNTGRIKPETLGKIPKNIYAYSFVPQIEVLQHTDVFVTHCGMNSIIEAMTYGVPMVAMPFINDQVSNAKQIVDLGIGKRIRSFPSNGKQLYKTVKEVYEDENIHNRTTDMQRSLINETPLDEVVSRIEKLLLNNHEL
jgi:MGT family glycosyltransferase